MALLLHRLPITATLLLLFLFLLPLSTTARPCRTFLVSSYSFRNPSSNTFATITEIRSLTPLYINNDNDLNNKPSFFFDRLHPINQHNLQFEPRASLPRAPLGFPATTSYDFTSLRDRTKDILSVVVALLFGVGCGALTAATMYLVWSVFSTRHDYSVGYDDFSDDDDHHRDGEIESPKKRGYVKIPAAEEGAAPPAKEAA